MTEMFLLNNETNVSLSFWDARLTLGKALEVVICGICWTTTIKLIRLNLAFNDFF
jgi:hypothetical protein